MQFIALGTPTPDSPATAKNDRHDDGARKLYGLLGGELAKDPDVIRAAIHGGNQHVAEAHPEHET